MRIIIGLGNPGKEYQNTRHNIGFRVLDKLVEHPDLTPVGESLKFHLKENFNAEIAETQIDGEKIIIIKPQTYMNESGIAVSKIAQFYKIEIQDIWVVSDDLDMPIGTIRIRLEGTSGGHNGLNSIIKHLSSEKFSRVRLGIGQATQLDMKEFDNYQPGLEAKEFVLSPFDEREEAMMKKTVEKAAEIIIEALKTNEGLSAHTVEVE